MQDIRRNIFVVQEGNDKILPIASGMGQFNLSAIYLSHPEIWD